MAVRAFVVQPGTRVNPTEFWRVVDYVNFAKAGPIKDYPVVGEFTTFQEAETFAAAYENEKLR